MKKAIKQKDIGKLADLTPQQQADYIKRKLGYVTFGKMPKKYLDTGSWRLNAVLGSKKRGIVYGKQITLAGKPSSGKTLLAALIAGMAQKDGAIIGWVDVENSFDAKWVKIHGLNAGDKSSEGGYSKIALFRPELGMFGKTRRIPSAEERLQTAEELFDVVERWMILQRKINKDTCKLCVVVDSTTAIQPEEELGAGLTGQNMRTKMLAPFLNLLTKRWVTVAETCNVIIIYISQLRTNPAQMFGNPEYIPGGGGVLYYPSIICKVKRVKNGHILQSGQIIGLRSVITNLKNKAGGGSLEGGTCGFKAFFQKFKWKFSSADKMVKEAKGGSDGNS